MSFERVQNYIRRHNRPTFVCVRDGKAKCMDADNEKVAKILRDYEVDKAKAEFLPVGFYTNDVAETDLAEDLIAAGVET
jgi:hypothetical protein